MSGSRTWHVGRAPAGAPLLHLEAVDAPAALDAAQATFAREALWCLVHSIQREPDRWSATPCARACPWRVSAVVSRAATALLGVLVTLALCCEPAPATIPGDRSTLNVIPVESWPSPNGSAAVPAVDRTSSSPRPRTCARPSTPSQGGVASPARASSTPSCATPSRGQRDGTRTAGARLPAARNVPLTQPGERMDSSRSTDRNQRVRRRALQNEINAAEKPTPVIERAEDGDKIVMVFRVERRAPKAHALRRALRRASASSAPRRTVARAPRRARAPRVTRTSAGPPAADDPAPRRSLTAPRRAHLLGGAS